MASQPSPFDPLDRIESGEDRFVIREKDPVGPAVITFWAHRRRTREFKLYGVRPTGDAERLLNAELAQCKEAEDKALDWSERQSGGEAPVETRASYVDAVLSEQQVSQARRQKLAADLERHLAEADYCAHELLELDGPAATPEQVEQGAAIHAIAMMGKA